MNRTKVLELCASTREGLVAVHTTLKTPPSIIGYGQNFRQLRDILWEALERVQEIAKEVGDEGGPTAGDPFRTPAGQEALVPIGEERSFRQCVKCGVPPWRASHEAVYASRESAEIHEKAFTATVSWPYRPNVVLEDMAEEGFYIRCTTCNYAWYEPMEDTGV